MEQHLRALPVILKNLFVSQIAFWSLGWFLFLICLYLLLPQDWQIFIQIIGGACWGVGAMLLLRVNVKNRSFISGCQQLISSLNTNEKKYREVINKIQEGFFLVDENGLLLEWNPSMEKITGLDLKKVLQKPFWTVFNLDRLKDSEQISEDFDNKQYFQDVISGKKAHNSEKLSEITYQRSNGETVYLQQQLFRLTTTGHVYVGCIMRDISLRVKEEEDLKRSEQYFRNLFENAPIAYQSLDETGNIIDVNAVWLEELKYSRSEVIGKPFVDFMVENDRERFHSGFSEFLKLERLSDGEFQLMTRPGDVISIQFNCRMGFGNLGKSKQIHCIFENVTERLRMEKELQQLAVTDSMTGLYNRRHFFDLVANEMKRSERHGFDLSVIMLDIDHFKQINDNYGHLIGDEVLKTLAVYVKSLLREIDVIGRYGGEEFIIMMPQTSLEDALLAAERLREGVMDLIIDTTRGRIKVTVSLGAADFLGRNDYVGALLDRADQAMYAAKQAGRNQSKSWKDLVKNSG